MATPYTFNQIGALVTMLATAVWIHIFLDMVIFPGLTFSEFKRIQYMELIVYIFFLLYAIRFKWSYIVGIGGSIFVLFFYLLSLFRYSVLGQLLKSTGIVDDVLYVLIGPIAILCLYFSYRSYKELTFSLIPIDLSTM